MAMARRSLLFRRFTPSCARPILPAFGKRDRIKARDAQLLGVSTRQRVRATTPGSVPVCVKSPAFPMLSDIKSRALDRARQSRQAAGVAQRAT